MGTQRETWIRPTRKGKTKTSHSNTRLGVNTVGGNGDDVDPASEETAKTHRSTVPPGDLQAL